MTAITPEQQHALAVARELVTLGMPMFLAHPDPDHWSGTGYALPVGWQRSTADPQVVDAWRPGMALCAVTGVVLDLIDIDPRAAGFVGPPDECTPPVAAAQRTPSGGLHYFVRPLGVASRDGVFPGVDVKSGTEDGHGRGFAFLAPTVRVSKVDGVAREYLWDQQTEPGSITYAINQIRAFGASVPGADNLRARIEALRARQPSSSAPRRIPQSVAVDQWNRACRKLTADVAHWATYGWGGEAHAGLLAATTHLARLHPGAAPEAFYRAFRTAGIEPDEQDLRKLETALSAAVPDIVVPDAEMNAQELFWAGAVIPEDRTPQGRDTGPPIAGLGTEPTAQTGYVFAPVSRDRFRDRPAPRKPTLGAFGGPHGLFYDSGVHWLQGESESGKSWVAQALIAELLRAGERVLYVDYEDTEGAVLGRFGALGTTEDEIELLTYVPGEDVLFTELADHVRVTPYAAVVVDGVTSALSAAGAKMNDNQEVTAWVNALPGKARMSVCIDHVTKATDERNGMAIGAQAKKSVVTGTAWEVICPPNGKFGQGQNGFIVLKVQKDKPGGVRAEVGHKSVVLTVLTDSLLGTVRLAAKRTAEVAEDEVAREAAARATELREAEEMYLAVSESCNPGDSQRKVIEWAIGSPVKRRLAGGKTAENPPGAHPGWKEHVIRSVWRVWTHISVGPSAATLNNQLERDLHGLVMGISATGASDLEKRPLAPSDQATLNGHVRKDADDLGTKVDTQSGPTAFDLWK